MPNENLSAKWENFGWETINIDGHNIHELIEAFSSDSNTNKPKVIIANTIKGKGITFLENDNKWHHNLLTKNDYEGAIKEILEK